MFRGIHNLILDEKGRLTLPNRYRDVLHAHNVSQLIVTIDTVDPCLLLYPLPIWETIEAKLVALPSLDAATRRIQRLLIGHATDLSLDNSNRLLLPQPLREYATLEKNLILVGQGKKIEIWNDTVWHNMRNTWLQAKEQPINSTYLQELSL